jgi:hypothetical protein
MNDDHHAAAHVPNSSKSRRHTLADLDLYERAQDLLFLMHVRRIEPSKLVSATGRLDG